MISITQIITLFSFAMAASTKGRPTRGQECVDYYYGECIPCNKEDYWNGECHNVPEYPQQPTNPCKKAKGLLGIGLGINLGNLLNVDLGLDVLTCKKLLAASVKAQALKNNQGKPLVNADVDIDV